jgi:ribokinase
MGASPAVRQSRIRCACLEGPGAVADVVCVASFNADLVSRVARPVARGETLLASGFEILPGGKGSNAAIACARQGARVAVLARLGDDDFGRMALALWAREGIDASAVEVASGERSGVAQIWVYDDGDNSIAVAPGAGASLGERQARAAAALLRGAKVVMASCEVPLAATQTAFEIAREGGATTLLNPAPARPLPAQLLRATDLLTPNEGELHALAGTTDTAAAAARLLDQGPRALLVTLGAGGCALFERGHTLRHLAGHAMKVVDTIGAGDTFTGALAAALARGEALEDAARWANAAGALSVTGSGAIGGMPTREAVAALLAAAPRQTST